MHENVRKCMKMYGNVWKMEMYENVWKCMKMYGKCMKMSKNA